MSLLLATAAVVVIVAVVGVGVCLPAPIKLDPAKVPPVHVSIWPLSSSSDELNDGHPVTGVNLEVLQLNECRRWIDF